MNKDISKLEESLRQEKAKVWLLTNAARFYAKGETDDGTTARCALIAVEQDPLGASLTQEEILELSKAYNK